MRWRDLDERQKYDWYMRMKQQRDEARDIACDWYLWGKALMVAKSFGADLPRMPSSQPSWLRPRTDS